MSTILSGLKGLMERLPSARILAAACVVLFLVLVLVAVPGLQAELAIGSEQTTAVERAEIVNENRKTLLQVIGGLVVLAGLYLTYRRIQITEDGQITERYTNAIAQLGNEESIEVRLGGLYALERIARESRKDFWTIMEVLTAFVRGNAPFIPDGDEATPKPGAPQRIQARRPQTDVQAALTVIGRRNTDWDEQGQRLDLTEVDLRGVNLREAHLEWADLSGAHLEGAYLSGVHLEWADLSGAHLEGATLWGAHLEGAILYQAHLEGADLSGAYLEGAILYQAHLEGVILFGAQLERANLRGSKGLTVDRLKGVRDAEHAQLDDDLWQQLLSEESATPSQETPPPGKDDPANR